MENELAGEGSGTIMLRLRRFDLSDNKLISSRSHISLEEANSMIEKWNSGFFNGKYFEMFAVQSDMENSVVGIISLFEHSKSIISIGPEIFMGYRQRGFAKAAMTEAMEIAKQKKYKIVLQQVRTNNHASIRLHESLGFERDDCVYKNAKGNDVYIYLKII